VLSQYLSASVSLSVIAASYFHPLVQTFSMVGESPILALALVIGTPVLLRYASVLRSTSRPRLRRKGGGPAEALLLLVLTVTALYHFWTLSPLSTSHRRARDIFRLTGLPIGAPSASLRARTTTPYTSRSWTAQFRRVCW
jgi:hypothetical protein